MPENTAIAQKTVVIPSRAYKEAQAFTAWQTRNEGLNSAAYAPHPVCFVEHWGFEDLFEGARVILRYAPEPMGWIVAQPNYKTDAIWLRNSETKEDRLFRTADILLLEKIA